MGGTPVTLDFSKGVPIDNAAAKPGAYQAKPGGPILNANVTLDFSKAQPIAGPGEQIGYSGLKDIVPKEGEAFADTMKRAIAYGKTLTKADLDKQTHADLKVAPAVLAAAPVMGAAGAGALTAGGEIAGRALAPTVARSTVGTGILDAAGNEFMRDVTTYGPSLVQQFGTKAMPWLINGAIAKLGWSAMPKVWNVISGLFE